MKMEGRIDYLPLKRITAMHAEEIHEAINGVVDGGWYLKGEATERFEKNYASFIGTKYCIGVGNGLDALTLILRAYIEKGVIHEGDEVIVPANTFIATILSITENRLKPVLVEPRLDTFEIDDSLIEQTITPRTRALMLVHLYGRCAYTERIAAICKRYDLLLIEDNAQAHGCRIPHVSTAPVLPKTAPSVPAPAPSGSAPASSGVAPSVPAPASSGVALPESVPYVAMLSQPQCPPLRTGSLGHAAAHSFYPGKNLGALGDAGAITTNDPELASLLRSIANYGSSRKYVFDHIGRNSRLDELQAAVLDVKLKYLDADNARRQAIANYYIENISNPSITLPEKSESVYHIFPILSSRREELQLFLKENGVETAIHYPIPPHQQLCYKDWGYVSLPVTERIHAQELSLPCHQAMTDVEVEKIATLVNLFHKSF